MSTPLITNNVDKPWVIIGGAAPAGCAARGQSIELCFT
jgi:hypothetical protein